MGIIIAVCTSERKGMRKKNIGEGILKVGFGLEGDAHGGDCASYGQLAGDGKYQEDD